MEIEALISYAYDTYHISNGGIDLIHIHMYIIYEETMTNTT